MKPSADHPEARKKPARHPWDEAIRTVIAAVALAVVFRSLAYEPFHIPSSSMEDTLLVGDYLFISKTSYGYSRYSFPLGLPLFEGRVWQTPPRRGDVAVFRLPSNPKIDFIKRVIGLPGDRIQMQDGVLYLNGEAVPKVQDGSYTAVAQDGRIVEVRKYEETLPGGKTYRVLDATRFGDMDNTPIYTVPDGHYFMMGDNRDNSDDSRDIRRVGFVPEENFVGRAEIVLFSVNTRTSLFNPSEWLHLLRSGRFLKSIE